MTQCPCGSKKTYDDCCGVFISGKAIPSTPEELMRSRYTAFTKADVDYIEETMKGDAAKNFDKPGTKKWMEHCDWISLQVLESEIDNKNPSIGYVEFVTQFMDGKKKRVLHEISEFHSENGHWYYVKGKFVGDKVQPQISNKVGRNDLCSCGSGKKFKKCCGKS